MTAPRIGGGHVPIDPGTGNVWGSDGAGNATPITEGFKSAYVYGVRADAQTVSDGAITSGLTALTSATGLFVAADVGKTIIVAGAGSAGDDLRTTITAFVSSTAVTVAAAAGGTVSNAGVSWGTDNKTALDAALTAVTPTAVGGRQVGGQTLILPPGSILTSGGHTWPNLVEITGIGAQATNIIHTGNNSCFTQAGSPLVTYGRSGFSRLTLWGNNGASARGVEIKGKQWGPYFEQAMIGNYANGIGLLLNNATAGDFVEGVTLDGLTLRSNLVGIEIRRTSGNSSFAYQRWNDFNVHVPANGVGILIGDDANSTATCQVYSGYISGNIWLEGNSAVAVKIGAFGEVDSNTTWIVRGEKISGSSVKALQINTGGKFYARGIHDFAVAPTDVQQTTDVANAAVYRPPTRTNESLAVQGMFRESFPRAAIQGATAPTAGTMISHLVEFRRGDVITGVGVGVSANGAGITLAKAAVWDSTGTLVASSADNSANFNAGTTPRVQTTPLSALYTIPYDGAFYVGFLFVTASPTLNRGVNLASACAALGSGILPFMQSAGGKSDVATTSVNATAAAYWVGVY